MNRVYLLRGYVLAVSILLFSTGAQAQETPLPNTAQTQRPLRFLMVGLGQDMSRIGDGIWHEDYEMIRLGAQGIADHPRVTPEEMATIQAALGEQFPAFVGHDQAVHQTAVELVRAAENRSMDDILRLRSHMERGCVACHSAFREKVRESLY